MGQIIQKLNKNLTGHDISDEVHSDVGSSAFELDHDTFFAGSDLEIWTGAGGTGTQLVEDTDYSVSGQDSDLSTEAGKDVYTLITVINGTYQSGDLYFTYKTLGDYVEAADINNAYKPVGALEMFSYGTPPEGYLECDGSAISRATYADLFTVIGDDYGNGDGSTTFNVPDYRGRFLRGWDHGAGTDPDAASRTDRGDGTTGDYVGTKQDDEFESHHHQVKNSTGGSIGSTAGRLASNLNNSGGDGRNSEDEGGNETRGKNINVMVCIKY